VNDDQDVPNHTKDYLKRNNIRAAAIMMVAMRGPISLI
jgi:hypothetical protein